MALGPVEWMEIGFPGSKLDASVVPTLKKFVDAGRSGSSTSLFCTRTVMAPSPLYRSLSCNSSDLLKQGILTDEEFAAQKARILAT